jgi:hypothetical protein
VSDYKCRLLGNQLKPNKVSKFYLLLHHNLMSMIADDQCTWNPAALKWSTDFTVLCLAGLATCRPQTQGLRGCTAVFLIGCRPTLLLFACAHAYIFWQCKENIKHWNCPFISSCFVRWSIDNDCHSPEPHPVSYQNIYHMHRWWGNSMQNSHLED